MINAIKLNAKTAMIQQSNIKQLEEMFGQVNIKVIRLKGYSSLNNYKGLDVEKAYKTAKQPIDKDYTNLSIPGLSQANIDVWLNEGGWVGLVIPQGYIFVDVDDITEAELLLEALQREDFKFHAIKTVRGMQFIFKDTEHVNTQVVNKMTAVGITVDYRLAGKGQVVLPTRNTEGRHWIAIEEKISELPFWLEPIEGKKDKLSLPIGEGERNSTLHEHAWRLLGNGFDDEEVVEVIAIMNANLLEDPLDEDEIKALLDSAFKRFAEKGKEIKNNRSRKNESIIDHIAIAKQILEEFPCFNDKQELYVYLNGVYVPGARPLLEKRIQEIYGDQARNQRIKETFNWIWRGSLLESYQVVNPDDGLVNVRNGLLNIRTGQLFPHTPTRLSTIQLPVSYDKEADCPEIKRFIRQIVPPDVLPVLEELFGYTLLPNCKYETAFVFTGEGANGKTTLINVIETFVGEENISNVSLHALDENRFAKQRLKDKLLNIDDDLPKKHLKESSEFKKIVSGSAIEIEKKGKDMVQMKPFAKLVFACNSLPKSGDNSNGFWRRWIAICFPNSFLGKEDRTLTDRLTTQTELSGLLNLAISGINRLEAQNGFSKSESIKETMSIWKYSNNTIEQFVEECCGTEGQVNKSELYSCYKNWAENAGCKGIDGKQDFYDKIKRVRGISETRVNNERYFDGISIKDLYNKSVSCF